MATGKDLRVLVALGAVLGLGLGTIAAETAPGQGSSEPAPAPLAEPASAPLAEPPLDVPQLRVNSLCPPDVPRFVPPVTLDQAPRGRFVLAAPGRPGWEPEAGGFRPPCIAPADGTQAAGAARGTYSPGNARMGSTAVTRAGGRPASPAASTGSHLQVSPP